MKNNSKRLFTELMLLNAIIGSEYNGLMGTKRTNKQSYCHTCIVGKKNPEMCEKCDRR